MSLEPYPFDVTVMLVTPAGITPDSPFFNVTVLGEDAVVPGAPLPFTVITVTSFGIRIVPVPEISRSIAGISGAIIVYSPCVNWMFAPAGTVYDAGTGAVPVNVTVFVVFVAGPLLPPGKVCVVPLIVKLACVPFVPAIVADA